MSGFSSLEGAKVYSQSGWEDMAGFTPGSATARSSANEDAGAVNPLI